ncbi:radical SAM protein [Candidatus Pacearchaeota archaeon]|nr:radical SAM protein [Candidatus Pacearchaeota archaeon]
MTNILLINPAEREYVKKEKKIVFPSLALQTVAGCFPEVEVQILNEFTDEIPYSEKYNLVGITINMTAKAPHAYELAKRFKEAGKKVILGGIHASALPQEALKYADSVVVGEVESVAPLIIKDLAKGALQKIYSGPHPDLHFSKPRRDIEDKKKFHMPYLFERSRGCPNDCHFCSVTRQYGPKYRTKPIEDITSELDDRNMAGKAIAFVDNNIVGPPHDYSKAKEFFKALIPYETKWFGQFDTRVEQDDELLDIMAESGCRAGFIGFETIEKKALESIGKKWNLIDKFSSLCYKLHKRGIGVIGSFIFGLDSDTPDVFQNNVKFTKKNGIEIVLFTKLTPFPGTRLYDEFKETGRMLFSDSDYPDAWKYHDGEHTVFKPKNMSIQDLDDGYKWAYKEFYGAGNIPPIFSILKRSIKFPKLYIPINIKFWDYSRKIDKELKDKRLI